MCSSILHAILSSAIDLYVLERSLLIDLHVVFALSKFYLILVSSIPELSDLGVSDTWNSYSCKS